MKQLIAYCGLDCEACEARIATLNNDDALRGKVSKLWSELNGVEITPQMINCVGCRMDGVKFPFCESMCPIRICAMEKKLDHCGECPQWRECDKLSMITTDNEQAVRNLSE